MSIPVRFRQVHLDFHNSPLIPDIGVDFDPQEFANKLKEAHVDSVTVFSKCHHGYCYYPSSKFKVHPNLKRDLLGEMIQAAHKLGIRTPVYTTVAYDELAWEEHPDWRVLFPDKPVTALHISNSPIRPGWKELCLNTPFADYVTEQLLEVLDNYEGDGLWVDIVHQRDCVCSYCRAEMVSLGIDPTDPDQRYHFGLMVVRRFMDRVSAAVWSRKPEQELFFNNRLKMLTPPELGPRPEMANFSHLELETLPAVFWGYEHFPIYARYFQTFGKELFGQTSRFDTVWGDFGGYRNKAALEFECYQALALGAACKIGDQLHPRGRMDPVVYRLIGDVYREVEKREAYCRDSRAMTEIGVFTAAVRTNTADGIPDIDKGSWRMLEQLKYQFQYIDAEVDLDPYGLIILPDEIDMDGKLAEKLRRYLAGGGALLATGSAGLAPDAGTAGQPTDFWLAAEMGVHYAGKAPFAPDYLLPGEELAGKLDVDHTVCQLPGVRVKAEPGSMVLATAGAPYFNRTWDHFTSHQYSPLEKPTDEPLIVQNGRVIYIARPLFSDYALLSRRPHRHIIDACIRRLLQPWVGQHNLPVTAIVTVRAQGNDLIVHLLNYMPQRRSRMIDILEDVIPLHDVKLSIRVERVPTGVMLVPEDEPADWTAGEDYIHIAIPRVCGYQIIQIKDALLAG